MSKFSPRKITDFFRNIEIIEDTVSRAMYRVFNEYGSDTGMISYLGDNEWRVWVDNFPGEKKYYQWNLPVRSLDEFKIDIERTGLELIPNES